MAAGFPEAGVAPLRRSPDGPSGLRGEDWATYLKHLIAASRVEQQRLSRGLSVRLTNFAVALKRPASRCLLALPLRRWRGLFLGVCKGTLVRLPSRDR